MRLNSSPLAAGQGREILPLAGDASFRRYFRVVEGDGSAVLMDAPPPHEDPRPFIAVAEWLASVGLERAGDPRPRPRHGACCCSAISATGGCAKCSTRIPQRERELYELATDVLVHLHRHPPMPGLPPHGLEQWLEELKLFTDWYCPAVGLRRRRATAIARPGREVLEPVAGDGLGPGHRACATIMPRTSCWSTGATGVAHFGLLDFQDALAGHPAYDLASVLEDARRDVPPEIERAMIDRYVAATGHGDAVRARLLGARRAAQHAHPRRLHPAVEARRQAALPRASSRACGACWSAISTQPQPGAGARLVRRQYRRPSIAREPWTQAA